MKRSLFSLATFVLLAGCATTAKHSAVTAIAYDKGDLERVAAAKTYHWSLPGESEINPYNNQGLYLKVVKAEIDAQLAKKGFKEVAKGGGLEVSFLVIYKDGVTTSVVDKYFGTNRAPERKIVSALKQVPPLDYEVGTLVVDAEDARDHESLWRGAVSAPVDRTKPFEAQKKRIDSSVVLLMKPFPASK